MDRVWHDHAVPDTPTTSVGLAPAPPGGSARPEAPHRVALFWRLFGAFAVVVGVAMAVLVFAPITVSVPTKPRELLVLMLGLAAMLAGFFFLLRRELRPLRDLTREMGRVDPLAPGRRIELAGADAEVAAVAEAYNAMLDRLEAERRGSARRAVAAQEAERARIARELHDEVGQALTGIMLEVEELARGAPDGLRVRLQDVRETARRSATEVRQIARGLRPEALDTLGLRSALAGLAREISREAGIEIDVGELRDPAVPLPAEAELAIYRVAQEALTNVARHAGARRAALALGPADGAIELAVRDDGAGIPPSVPPGSSGIRGMRERALLIGAELTVAPRTEGGTEVRLRVPAAVR